MNIFIHCKLASDSREPYPDCDTRVVMATGVHHPACPWWRVEAQPHRSSPQGTPDA